MCEFNLGDSVLSIFHYSFQMLINFSIFSFDTKNIQSSIMTNALHQVRCANVKALNILRPESSHTLRLLTCFSFTFNHNFIVWKIQFLGKFTSRRCRTRDIQFRAALIVTLRHRRWSRTAHRALTIVPPPEALKPQLITYGSVNYHLSSKWLLSTKTQDGIKNSSFKKI